MKTALKAGCILFLNLFLVFAGSGYAEEEKKQAGPLVGIEYLTGFAQAKLREKGSYSAVPMMVDFDFNLKPLTKKIGFNPPGLLQFQLEPFINPVYRPDSNVEIGNSFLIKIGFLPDNFKFQPYFKGGAGLIYITQHTREQSTQFNFVEYAGCGIHYFFNKNTAFTVEGRYRHLSNASIKQPNKGIDTYFFLAGLSYLF
ncbi:MAG: acyloxyacyl hydrolase [Candidatus Omnitrophica bacterium]|nr:acyloxyacyl hydrolase [Candidatus Omnitrophota bacterium]